ncbi:hypothetical protein ACFE04_020156 [Oxalis oulophora]
MVIPCWRSSSVDNNDISCAKIDGLMWYLDLAQHVYGDFSMASIQANVQIEDHCQVESGVLSFDSSGPRATFIGVYDGHGGPDAARFVNNNLFRNLKSFVHEHNNNLSENVVRKAFLATDEEFLSLVRKQWFIKPQMASVGSCCLAGVICNGLLYIANAGDSRAVLGRVERSTRQVIPMQLSDEHNASSEMVRRDLQWHHPDDPQIVVLKHKVWRVKGIIQVSRSIGDAYLKSPEFNREPLLPKFRVKEPFTKPILTAEPAVLVHKLHAEDQFLIFASDGLWEHLSNHEAVDIVQNGTRNGAARRLIKAALKEAAKKREMRYTDLKKIDRGVRRHFHDDITVIVVFLDYNLMSENSSPHSSRSFSIKGGETPKPDDF